MCKKYVTRFDAIYVVYLEYMTGQMNDTNADVLKNDSKNNNANTDAENNVHVSNATYSENIDKK